MIIIGHPWIESPQFCKIFSKEDIAQTQPTQIVLLESLSKSHTIARYCQKNSISFSLIVQTLTEALFANALGAKYIICKEKDAKLMQSIASEYLFDTRILVSIDNENKIEKIAKEGIDGVIFDEAIYRQ